MNLRKLLERHLGVKMQNVSVKLALVIKEVHTIEIQALKKANCVTI